MGREVTFRDRRRQEAFDRDGFVVFPFLEPEEVAHLRRSYRSLTPAGEAGLTSDHLRHDRSIPRAVEELAAPVWERRFPEVFVDHRPVFTSVVTKHPGADSALRLHDDRTYVDERSTSTGTLWIPLVDVGPELRNGCLLLVAGSHRLGVGWTGTETPELLLPYDAWLAERALRLTVPAGHAVYYSMHTLHGSEPNLTDDPREAIVCPVAPRSAPLVHVVATGRRGRRLHQVDDSFFVDVHPHEVVGVGLDPEHHPVLDELIDDRRVGVPQLVDGHLADDGDDVAFEPQRAALAAGLDPRPRRLPLVEQDLPPGLGRPVRAGERCSGAVEVLGVHGCCSVVEPSPAGADALGRWLPPAVRDLADGADESVMAIIERGAALTVRIEPDEQVDPPRRRAWTLDVVDAATGSASIEVGGKIVPLDESLRLGVPTGEPMVLRNVLPGPAVLLLAAGTVASGTERPRRWWARARTYARGRRRGGRGDRC